MDYDISNPVKCRYLAIFYIRNMDRYETYNQNRGIMTEPGRPIRINTQPEKIFM